MKHSHAKTNRVAADTIAAFSRRVIEASRSRTKRAGESTIAAFGKRVAQVHDAKAVKNVPAKSLAERLATAEARLAQADMQRLPHGTSLLERDMSDDNETDG